MRACLAVVTIILLQNSPTWVSGHIPIVCKSAECQRLATFFQNNMNPNGQPCHDFYDYVCKGWSVQNPRPIYINWWTIEKVMDFRATENLKQLLENTKVSAEPDIEEARALYKACVNLPYMDKKDAKIITDVMTAVGDWPMFLPKNKNIPATVSWSMIDNQYIKKTGESALMKFTLTAEESMGNKIMLTVGRPYSAYGMLKRTPWVDPKEKLHYKTFLNKLVFKIAPSSLPITIVADLDNVIKFRENLNEIARNTGKQELQTITIAKFQTEYNKVAKTLEMSQIDWLEKIRALYKNSKDPYGKTVYETSTIMVDKKFFSNLAGLLPKYAKNVIANHIHLYFAERHLNLDPSMMLELQQSFDDSAFPTGHIRYEPERWRSCINNNNMKTALGKMYVKAHFPKSNRDEVQEMFEEAKKLLQNQILESDWLNPAAKNKSMEKVRKIKSQLGYPDWYDPISKTPFEQADLNPLEAEAYFMRELNKLYATAAYLQWPIYSPKLPYVIRYGSTIAMLGHELYHGFDTQGILYDINGVEQPWLSDNMMIQYKTQITCMEDHYKKFRMQELLKFKFAYPPTLPSTVDEDIADVMGLKLAFKGFQDRLQSRNGLCPVLPGFEKLGCEKLFFIAYANSFCTYGTPAGEEKALLSDIHSLPRVRVNAAVANMNGFSRVFGCKAGDPLKSANTCSLWKNVTISRRKN